MDIETAQRIVDWCLDKEGPPQIIGVVDSEDFDRIAFNVSFWLGKPHTEGSKVNGVRIPCRWLEDCNPDRSIISPEMRGLMVELARLRQQTEGQ